jgi:hypothetical protein
VLNVLFSDILDWKFSGVPQSDSIVSPSSQYLYPTQHKSIRFLEWLFVSFCQNATPTYKTIVITPRSRIKFRRVCLKSNYGLVVIVVVTDHSSNSFVTKICIDIVLFANKLKLYFLKTKWHTHPKFWYIHHVLQKEKHLYWIDCIVGCWWCWVLSESDK